MNDEKMGKIFMLCITIMIMSVGIASTIIGGSLIYSLSMADREPVDLTKYEIETGCMDLKDGIFSYLADTCLNDQVEFVNQAMNLIAFVLIMIVAVGTFITSIPYLMVIRNNDVKFNNLFTFNYNFEKAFGKF